MHIFSAKICLGDRHKYRDIKPNSNIYLHYNSVFCIEFTDNLIFRYTG